MEFNEEVQMDLLFYTSLLESNKGQRIVLHLIDSCARSSATGVLKSEEETELCTAIARIWFILGVMQTLTMDNETGMSGQCALDWAAANGVLLKFSGAKTESLDR